MFWRWGRHQRRKSVEESRVATARSELLAPVVDRVTSDLLREAEWARWRLEENHLTEMFRKGLKERS